MMHKQKKWIKLIISGLVIIPIFSEKTFALRNSNFTFPKEVTKQIREKYKQLHKETFHSIEHFKDLMSSSPWIHCKTKWKVKSLAPYQKKQIQVTPYLVNKNEKILLTNTHKNSIIAYTLCNLLAKNNQSQQPILHIGPFWKIQNPNSNVLHLTPDQSYLPKVFHHQWFYLCTPQKKKKIFTLTCRPKGKNLIHENKFLEKLKKVLNQPPVAHGNQRGFQQITSYIDYIGLIPLKDPPNTFYFLSQVRANSWHVSKKMNITVYGGNYEKKDLTGTVIEPIEFRIVPVADHIMKPPQHLFETREKRLNKNKSMLLSEQKVFNIFIPFFLRWHNKRQIP